MSKVAITYLLSATGQKANLKAGGTGKAIQTITLTAASPAWADAVDQATINSDGDGAIELIRRSGYWPEGDSAAYDNRRLHEWDTTPTVEDLLAHDRVVTATLLIGDRIRKEAEEAKREAEVNQVLTCPLGDLILGGDNPALQYVTSGPWSDPRTHARQAEAIAELERRRAIHAAEVEAKKAAEKEQERLGREQLAAWVDQHGSELSRLRKEECMNWIGTAREEYAEWVSDQVAGELKPVEDRDADEIKVEDRKSPTVDEIKALRATRSRIGDLPASVRLVLVRYDDDSQTELEVTVTVPGDGEISNYYHTM